MVTETGALSSRAGIFRAQGSGPDAYQTFTPHPLSASTLNLEGRLRARHEQASLALGRLDGSTVLLPNTGHFLWLYIRKEAVLSSQIEGTQSTLTNLVLHENKQAPGVPRADVEEVSNYVAAMRHGLDRIAGGFPLCLRLLREVQKILVTQSLGSAQAPGEFRRIQNWVGGSHPSHAQYVPPPPNELTRLLADFETFLHDQDVPPILKAGLAHAQFETIHPFLDGNGRVGRLLITLILNHERVLEQPLLYMSLHFKRHRQEYYDRLQRIRTQGDWDGWMDFYLHGLATVANKAAKTIGKLHELMNSDRAACSQRSGSVYQAAAANNNVLVYDLLCQRLVLTASETSAQLGITARTAKRVLTDMNEGGMVREITGKQRGQVFLYKRFLDVLEEGT